MTTAALWPSSPANRQAISRDSGVFLYTGWRILQGEIPYRDIWDHKTPGIFYLDALGLALDADSLWGVWGLEWLFVCAATILLFLLVRRLFGALSAMVSLSMVLFVLADLLAGGNLTQLPALPFQAGGLWLALKLTRNPEESRTWLWLGVLTACTVLFRQNSIGIFVAAAAWMLIWAALHRKPAPILGAALNGLAGVLIVALPVVLYFAYHSALADLWDASFLFNFYYASEGGVQERIAALASGFQALGGMGLAVFLLAGFVLAVPAWVEHRTSPAPEIRRYLQYLSLAFVLEIALVVMSGRPRLPYFIAVLPVATVLTGYCFSRLENWIAGKSTRATAQRILAFSLVLGLFYAYPKYQETLRANQSIQRPLDVISYIQQHTSHEDQVLLVGAETSINFETRRTSPTRFVYQYPLQRQAYAQPDYLEEFFEDVLSHRPALIILTTGDSDMPNRFGGSKTARSEELAYQINQNYQAVHVFENGWIALAPLAAD